MMILKFTKFSPAHPATLRGMPGQYRVKTGFVYAVFLRFGRSKIGASTNPRCRILDMCAGDLKQIHLIALSKESPEFRQQEKRLHVLLQPRWQTGDNALSEWYVFPSFVKHWILDVFESDFDQSVIASLRIREKLKIDGEEAA